MLISRIGYIVQGHRYDIAEDIGCIITVYSTPVHIALVGIPPILIGLVTMYYAVLTIIVFNRRRVEFKDHLAQHSKLSSSLYLRLICFGGLEILGTVPIASYFLSTVISSGIHPWISWSDTHWQFSAVLFFPRSIWENSPAKIGYELGRWIPVIYALVFLAFFGFTEDARNNYSALYLTVAKHIGLSTTSSKPSGSPRPWNKSSDIEADVFAHTTTTTISISNPDSENHTANTKEDQMPQVNTTSANTVFNADVSK